MGSVGQAVSDWVNDCLIALASVLSGVASIGLAWLWFKWRANYVWVHQHIVIPNAGELVDRVLVHHSVTGRSCSSLGFGLLTEHCAFWPAGSTVVNPSIIVPSHILNIYTAHGGQ
ncbi:unnamed protein product [Colletotrichum noveboracense]|uniref:Uncharacterized protein n=1 Tax=Colletotrichum noveboracense TaxID=2664923 RepID=A0A9W4S015_9PEZI|nr:unnamed protein product [Colletotrichum noveboracense]